MSRKPQRHNPKVVLQVQVGSDAYAGIEPLRHAAAAAFTSESQLVEAVLFLAEATHVEYGGDSFAYELRDVKVRRLMDLPDLRLRPSTFRLKATVDEAAHLFLGTFADTYRGLFGNSGEALSLIFLYLSRYCDDPRHVEYLVRRLRQALARHPCRPSGPGHGAGPAMRR